MFSGWTDRRAVAPVIAEMAGTFLFFFVAIGAVAALAKAGTVDAAGGLIVVALAHGIVLAVLVSALGAVSGGHFNPAVTFAVWLAGRMPWRQAAAYVVAQLIGAILAAWSLTLVFTAAPLPGTPAVAASVSPLGAIFVEAVLTVILVAAVFGTALDARGPRLGGLAIGFAVAADILMGGALTGGAMNPARWFGPAAVNGLWDNWYVWIVGPLVGAGLVALAWRYLFLPDTASTPATLDG